MTHFALIAAVKHPDDLDTALAPFDENKEVAPYRDYFEDWEKTYSRALGFYKECPEDKPAGLDEKNVPEVLSDYEDMEVHEDTTGDKVRYYTVVTYNPNSKWDWWIIGGRYAGKWATNSPGHPDLLTATPAWNTPRDMLTGTVNGGPKKLLDLDESRTRVSSQAATEWDAFHRIADKHPGSFGWSHFYGKVSDTYPIDQARTDYREQPLWSALEGTEFDLRMGCPVDEYAVDRAVYIDRHRARANVGYALLTLDGEWIAPGDMGWFGMSSDDQSDRDAYYERANAYIDSLDGDTYLIVVDCHI
ncbi:hypothetical protein Q8791_23160 [Nocardiopsis sp. CT-R113]|uniref:Uncharacterized protein n=1 Tax=Nocardiopsis codii TaxID=3065942 RepID=A0ABU7KD10_9ACTN|nr:hypothetical protein [Nocardiopsis sp. CT-R113]MEE2040121.1 hypothetical protein [Nocardiopsis sp. CT-R113]